MPVQSHSTDVDIFTYCSNWLLKIEDTELWDHGTGTINPADPDAGLGSHLAGTYKVLRVPSFQRGIEWSFNTLLECIDSKSESLGTIVIGRAQSVPNVDYILDGLQRLAAFTYLLHRLDRILFIDPDANNTNPWGLHPALLNRASFAALRNVAALHVGKRGRFEYNFRVFKRLQRRIVAQSYQDWCDRADREMDRLLDPQDPQYDSSKSGAFLDNLAAFVAKPLVVLEMSGFQNVPALLATFLGLNSIRVELTGADVCRSVVIESLLEGHASPDLVLEIDNDYNDSLLTPTGRVKRGLSPFVKVLEHEWVEDRSGNLIPSLFVSPANAAQIKVEFDELAGWVNTFSTFRSTSNYLNFIALLSVTTFWTFPRELSPRRVHQVETVPGRRRKAPVTVKCLLQVARAT